jgi:Cof subfamily protein (haloacid dehalogenase superfamily)
MKKPLHRRPVRLVAVDMDGTLLCPAGKVTPRTKAAVRKAVDAGIRICFATGRSWRESHSILEAVDHYDAAVFVTGAMVVDTKAKKTIHRKLMGRELSREVSHFFQERGQTVLALQDTAGEASGSEQVDVDYLVTETGTLDEATRRWIELTKTNLRRSSELANAAAHEHTVRISIVASPEQVNRCLGELNEAFKDRVACHELLIPSTRTYVLEVFDPMVNKWHGVRQVAARHGIEDSEIAAVGDDTNDVPMLRAAALGVAMGNARKPAIEAAQRVIGHNNKDGLAEFLEELIESNEKF